MALSLPAITHTPFRLTAAQGSYRRGYTTSPLRATLGKPARSTCWASSTMPAGADASVDCQHRGCTGRRRSTACLDLISDVQTASASSISPHFRR